jgi:hypothetical protein
MDSQGKQSPSEGMTDGARRLMGRGREDNAAGGNIELIFNWVGVVIKQINLKNVMLYYRQPQRHCKNAMKNKFWKILLDLPKNILFWYSWGLPKLINQNMFFFKSQTKSSTKTHIANQRQK